MERAPTTTTADAISPSLDDTLPMVHRLETVEVSTEVLNAALRHGSSGRMPVTAGIAEDGSEDEGEARFEDSLHPRTQHESTRAAAPPGAGLTTLRCGSDGIRQDSVMYSDPAGPKKGQHHHSTSQHLDVGTVRYADSYAPPPDVDRQVVKGRNRHSSLLTFLLLTLLRLNFSLLVSNSNFLK